MGEPQPIFVACATGDLAAVSRLLDDDPELVIAVDECALTPLHVAVRDGNIPLATLLINRGADVDAVDDEHRATPLGWAVFYGRCEMVALLLDAGADPTMTNAYGDTPLQCARRGKAGEWKPFAKQATEADYDAIIARLEAYCEECERESGF